MTRSRPLQTYAIAFTASALAMMVNVLPSQAQSSDMSPVLLIETGPSDIVEYRRIVFVKYLAGDQVTASYKAYNRSEFIRLDDTTPDSFVAACANGRASTLEEILAFQAQNAETVETGEPPIIAHFCIKNVPNWTAENQATYLDPIFEGMPYAATLNN